MEFPHHVPVAHKPGSVLVVDIGRINGWDLVESVTVELVKGEPAAIVELLNKAANVAGAHEIGFVNGGRFYALKNGPLFRIQIKEPTAFRTTTLYPNEAEIDLFRAALVASEPT